MQTFLKKSLEDMDTSSPLDSDSPKASDFFATRFFAVPGISRGNPNRGTTAQSENKAQTTKPSHQAPTQMSEFSGVRPGLREEDRDKKSKDERGRESEGKEERVRKKRKKRRKGRYRERLR